MNTNNNYYTPQETEIDLIELLWRMLAQWKAILVCALIMALLVPSAVYLREIRVYDAVQAEAEKEVDDPIDPSEAIEGLLAALKPKDRPAVEQALSNDEIIEAKRVYLKNSILLNLDPKEAVTAIFGYYVTCDAEPDELYALYKGYIAAFGDSGSLTEIMGAMGLDSEPQYMKEIVWVDEVPDGDTAKVIQVNIICPDVSMLDGAAEAADNIMKDACDSLSDTLVKHSVKRIYTQSNQRTLESLSTAQSNAYGALYNLQSQQRAHIGTFNEEQKAAYEAITEIRNTMLNVSEAADIVVTGDTNNSNDSAEGAENGKSAKPEFSKKYAALGFVLGAFLYMMIYVAWLLLSRRIDNARAVQLYTSARLLGEYYYSKKKGGLYALFHSKAVTKHRYGNKMDLSAQADKTTEAIFASCTNKGIKEIALLQLFEDAEDGSGAGTFINEVSKRLRAADVKLIIDTIHAFPAPDEKELSDKKNAVFFVTDNTKTTTLDNTLGICKDYSIGKIGTVFIGQE